MPLVLSVVFQRLLNRQVYSTYIFTHKLFETLIEYLFITRVLSINNEIIQLRFKFVRILN